MCAAAASGDTQRDEAEEDEADETARAASIASMLRLASMLRTDVAPETGNRAPTGVSVCRILAYVPPWPPAAWACHPRAKRYISAS